MLIKFNICVLLVIPDKDDNAGEYLQIFFQYLLGLILLIFGIRTIMILVKKRAKFSTFEKQLLSLLILKCVYELISAVVVS